MQHDSIVRRSASFMHSARAVACDDDVAHLDQSRDFSVASRAKSQHRMVRPATVPKEFNLSTSKRAERYKESDPKKKEWKSLAQLVREFQTRTPPRFRNGGISQTMSHAPLHITEPKSPTLHTALRHGQSTPSSSEAAQAAADGSSPFQAIAEKAMKFKQTLRDKGQASRLHHSAATLWNSSVHSEVFAGPTTSSRNQQHPQPTHSSSTHTAPANAAALRSVPVESFQRLQISIPEDPLPSEQDTPTPLPTPSPIQTRTPKPRPTQRPINAPLSSLRHSLPSLSPYLPHTPSTPSNPLPHTPVQRSRSSTTPSSAPKSTTPASAKANAPIARTPSSAPPPFTTSPSTRTPANRRWSTSASTPTTPTPKPSTTPTSRTPTSTNTSAKARATPTSIPQHPATTPTGIPSPAAANTRPRTASASSTLTAPTASFRNRSSKAPATSPSATATRRPLSRSTTSPLNAASHTSAKQGSTRQPTTPSTTTTRRTSPASQIPSPASTAPSAPPPTLPSVSTSRPATLQPPVASPLAQLSPTDFPPLPPTAGPQMSPPAPYSYEAGDSPVLTAIRQADAALWDSVLGIADEEADAPLQPPPLPVPSASSPTIPAQAATHYTSLAANSPATHPTRVSPPATAPASSPLSAPAAPNGTGGPGVARYQAPAAAPASMQSHPVATSADSDSMADTLAARDQEPSRPPFTSSPAGRANGGASGVATTALPASRALPALPEAASPLLGAEEPGDEYLSKAAADLAAAKAALLAAAKVAAAEAAAMAAIDGSRAGRRGRTWVLEQEPDDVHVGLNGRASYS